MSRRKFYRAYRFELNLSRSCALRPVGEFHAHAVELNRSCRDMATPAAACFLRKVASEGTATN
jgi:hypothetical protein